MENVLLKYFEDRYHKTDAPPWNAAIPRPVITLSREYGCPARDVSSLLLASLNAGKKSKEPGWRLISKEILQASAEELHVHPSKIEYVFNATEKSVFDDIIDSLATRQYKSDKAIRTVAKDIVKGLAFHGNLIILGMGGASMLHNHANVLNIKLTGPPDWRAANISRWKGITLALAKVEMQSMDEAREKVLHSFLPPKVQEPHFDITYNCLNIGTGEIVETIISLLALRTER